MPGKARRGAGRRSVPRTAVRVVPREPRHRVRSHRGIARRYRRAWHGHVRRRCRRHALCRRRPQRRHPHDLRQPCQQRRAPRRVRRARRDRSASAARRRTSAGATPMVDTSIRPRCSAGCGSVPTWYRPTAPRPELPNTAVCASAETDTLGCCLACSQGCRRHHVSAHSCSRHLRSLRRRRECKITAQGESHGRHHDAADARSRRPFRAPDPALEPEDEAIHLR